MRDFELGIALKKIRLVTSAGQRKTFQCQWKMESEIIWIRYCCMILVYPLISWTMLKKKKYCWWRTYFVCRWWVRAFFHVQCIVWRKLRTFFLFLQKRLFMSRIVFRTNAFLSMKLIAVDILMRRACSESVIFLLSVIAHRSKVSMILLPK